MKRTTSLIVLSILLGGSAAVLCSVYTVVCGMQKNALCILFVVFCAYFLIVGIVNVDLAIEINNENYLIQGENKKIRKQKKRILKLQAKKGYLEKKKEREGEVMSLQCKIHNLKLEIKGKQVICEQCGAKIYARACYCEKCGYQIREAD